MIDEKQRLKHMEEAHRLWKQTNLQTHEYFRWETEREIDRVVGSSLVVDDNDDGGDRRYVRSLLIVAEFGVWAGEQFHAARLRNATIFLFLYPL